MRILMSMFGWNDVGGGTSYPRQVAVNLVRQGHQVCVFYAAVPSWLPATAPTRHRLVRHSEDGVELVAVVDRPSIFLDIRRPDREVEDAALVASFREVFESFGPDIVHYHNFLGLSAGIARVAYEAGVPSLFSAHNFWMICPTLYLYLPNGALCGGVNADGSNCLGCARVSADPWTPFLPPAQAYVDRRDTLRADFLARVDLGLVNAEAVRRHFLNNGYPPDSIRVQKLSNPRIEAIWQKVGEQRTETAPARLRIGFLGQVIPIKGVHTLVQAAQLLKGDYEIQIHGNAADAYQQSLEAIDQRGVVRFYGEYGADDQVDKLRNIDLGVVTSIWFDHSPLVISEFHSARIPVIGADIGGVADYLQPAASFLYPAGDVQALAKLLQRLLDDRAELEAMKRAIVRPPGPEAYLEGILEDYHRLVAASRQPDGAHHARRLDGFLARRAAGLYAAESLFALSAPDQPYGLDLHPHSPLLADIDLLAKARWRISPDAALASALTEQGLLTWWLPLARRPVSAEVLAPRLPQTAGRPVLIPLDADGGWRPLLQAFLAAPAPDWTPLLLPWNQPLEVAQDALVAAIEAEGIDLEAAPEMVLLDDEDEEGLRALFQQAEAVFLPAMHDARLQRLAGEARRLLLAAPAGPDYAPLDGEWQPAGLAGWELVHLADAPEAYNLGLRQQLAAWLASLPPLP